jgi:hypothetical protein
MASQKTTNSDGDAIHYGKSELDEKKDKRLDVR